MIEKRLGLNLRQNPSSLSIILDEAAECLGKDALWKRDFTTNRLAAGPRSDIKRSMTEDSFDKILTLLSNRVHVAHIMVTDPDFCTKTDDPLEVLETMQRNNYEIMPIKEQDRVIGYVERGTLMRTKQIYSAMRQIKLDGVISADTSAHEMIKLFRRSKFFFVNRVSDLVGLVTYADIDKIPVRLWLYVLISRFEILLHQLIGEFYDGSSWMNVLAPSRRSKIAKLFDEKRRNDVDISLQDCLNLGDMISLLECDNKLRLYVGYASRNLCRKEISGLDALRNSVMHPSNSLISSYDGVKVLDERIERLQQAIERVESRLLGLK